MMAEFYFLRHGETDWNLTGQLIGHIDKPLNDTGRSQALAWQSTVQNLPITHVYYSDLLRAAETAQILSVNQPWQLVPKTEWRSPNFGSNHGLTHVQIEQAYAANPEAYKPSADGYFYALDGETADVFHDRIANALNALLAQPSTQKMLIVSHREAFRACVRHLNVDIEAVRPKNCQPYHFYQQNGA